MPWFYQTNYPDVSAMPEDPFIYAEGQFRTVEFIGDAEPSQAQYDAIDDALAGPYVLPETVVHFAAYPVNELVWGEIGGYVFCHRWGTVTEIEE